LRAVAFLKASSKVHARSAVTVYRARSRAIHRYVLCRAQGTCEACGASAPFTTPLGSPYLEPITSNVWQTTGLIIPLESSRSARIAIDGRTMHEMQGHSTARSFGRCQELRR
jgi:hypothetical protein